MKALFAEFDRIKFEQDIPCRVREQLGSKERIAHTSHPNEPPHPIIGPAAMSGAFVVDHAIEDLQNLPQSNPQAAGPLLEIRAGIVAWPFA